MVSCGMRTLLAALLIATPAGVATPALAFDTTPGYLDTCAQPAALTKWKYRGIYRVGEAQVGQWSAEQTIAVGG